MITTARRGKRRPQEEEPRKRRIIQRMEGAQFKPLEIVPGRERTWKKGK